jgi:hypothetical protein
MPQGWAHGRHLHTPEKVSSGRTADNGIHQEGRAQECNLCSTNEPGRSFCNE